MYPTPVLFSHIMNNAVSKEATGPRLNARCSSLVDFTGTFFLFLFLSCFYIVLDGVILQVSVLADSATPAATVVNG